MKEIPLPRAKRVFDIFTSVVVIIALSPLLILLFVLFTLEQIFIPSSRGSFFYNEIRISQGKQFRLWKIRTFKEEVLRKAKLTGEVIQTKQLEHDKHNLTYTGMLLRQIYMDEAPQLWSVLIGDMSFVGPRPTNVTNYENDLQKGFEAKKILKAGLTGKFQTHKHIKHNLNQETIDMEYAEMCKEGPAWKIFFYDLSILFQTLITVFRAEGL